jgi:hypothetical protein
VIVGYGNFHQVVLPMPAGGGHVSVCAEPDADPVAVAGEVGGLVAARAG